MPRTINDPDIRAAIAARVEAELASVLAREQREEAFNADSEWRALDAQIMESMTRQREIEDRIKATVCDSYGGHVAEYSLGLQSNWCARCHRPI